jgi:Fe-S cluster assembly protein SufD
MGENSASAVRTAAPAADRRVRREPGWMAEVRVLAADRFREMAWPDTSQEEWRRTDLSRFGLSRFTDAVPVPGPSLDAARGSDRDDEPPRGVAGRAAFLSSACTHLSLSPAAAALGARLLPLADALEEFEEPLREIFLGAVRGADNRLIPWHFAELTHGAFLFVPPLAEIEEPFLVDLAAGPGDTLLAPHLTVVLGRGARASVIERASGGGPGPLLWNAAADLLAADGSSLSCRGSQELSAQALVFRHAALRAGRDARVLHGEASFGGRLVKTRVDCALEGSGAEAHLEGLYFPCGGQHMDIRSVQRHTAPHASSRAYYKGAVRDDGRAVFQGLIEVSPGAAGTDAFLTNRNLVLNDGARSDSIPSLKIGNNDVKCSHGSTTGRIDEDHLFYLESRGLTVGEAKEMIVTGYFEDLLGDAPEAYRETVISAVKGRLADGAPAALGASAPPGAAS